MSAVVHLGDCLEVMRTLESGSAQTCVTSPPYFGLRDYKMSAQIGLEGTPEAYIEKLVAVFREVRRVLRDDGTLWLNIGDSYATHAPGKVADPMRTSGLGKAKTQIVARNAAASSGDYRKGAGHIPEKNLIGIPWMLAFALRADGWYLRQDIIWCLSGGAWVYARTQKGDMPVMVKDLVRLDPSTIKVWNGKKWTQVLGWGKNTDPQQRTELVLRSGERIGSTGNHQWPTQRGNVRTDELRVGDVLKTCRLPEPTTVRPAYLTDDAVWFAGLYLAEGSMSKDTIQIAGHAKELERLERVRRVAAHYGGTVNHTLNGNTLDIRVRSRVLRAVLSTYLTGATAKDKALSNAAWRLPDDALQLLMEGYLSGDGHNDAKNGRWRLGFTRNYNLERDLRTLAARLDATLTLIPTVSHAGEKRHAAFRGEWRWERSGHRNEKDRGEIMDIRASRARQFWDIAVADEPHLFALASGVLTHNCKPNPMPESVTDRCTKAHEYVFLLSKGPRYYYNQDAIKEPSSGLSGGGFSQKYAEAQPDHGAMRLFRPADNGFRNKRSVWTITDPTVRLRDDLDPEQRVYVLGELARRGLL